MIFSHPKRRGLRSSNSDLPGLATFFSLFPSSSRPQLASFPLRHPPRIVSFPSSRTSHTSLNSNFRSSHEQGERERERETVQADLTFLPLLPFSLRSRPPARQPSSAPSASFLYHSPPCVRRVACKGREGVRLEEPTKVDETRKGGGAG